MQNNHLYFNKDHLFDRRNLNFELLNDLKVINYLNLNTRTQRCHLIIRRKESKVNNLKSTMNSKFSKRK
ncbi:unnamed protein product [Paramecium octaurelia]|uniref:Uncharacterized protein n=1 Tax=Paramecium octaurelia TaxID=43137 RepID=A0A8S1TBQ1_PAROT|nr:unnamed protein product [Paramecium octaurelia]